MPLRVALVHLKRSNHVATLSIDACAVRSTLIGETDTNPCAIGVEVRAGAGVLAGPGGADPIDRPVVRVERLHRRLGLVAEAEARRAHALELLERHVGHVDVQDRIGRQRIGDVALDELANELGCRRVVLEAVQARATRRSTECLRTGLPSPRQRYRSTARRRRDWRHC